MKKIRQKIGTDKTQQASKNKSPADPSSQKEVGIKFVSVPVKPLSKVSEGSIFHSANGHNSSHASSIAESDAESLDEILWASVKKHFQRKQSPTKNQNESSVRDTFLDQSSVVDGV